MPSAYPTANDLIRFLLAGNLLSAVSVTTGAASTGQTLSTTADIRVGDTLYFVTAQTSAVVTAVGSATAVTLGSSVTTTTGERAVIVPATLDLTNGIAAGIAAFEQEVGRRMLATADTTREYDPPIHPHGILNLADDLAQLTTLAVGSGETTVTTGAASTTQTVGATAGMSAGTRVYFAAAGVTRTVSVVNSGASVTFTSSVTTTTGERAVVLSPKILNSDFRLHPLGAAGKGQPWAWIEFKARYLAPLSWSSLSTVIIDGRWAYSATTIPGDAWNAMCAAGALARIPQLALATQGGLVEWHEGGASERYQDPLFQGTADAWKMLFQETTARYRRRTMG